MAAAKEAEKIQMICGACCSTLVTRDAWAEWDSEQQEWTLGAIYDFAFCHACEVETRIEEVRLS